MVPTHLKSPVDPDDHPGPNLWAIQDFFADLRFGTSTFPNVGAQNTKSILDFEIPMARMRSRSSEDRGSVSRGSQARNTLFQDESPSQLAQLFEELEEETPLSV